MRPPRDTSLRRNPLLQFALLFAQVSAIGTLAIPISNLLLGVGLWYESMVNIPLMLGQSLIFISIFTLIVWLRFRRLFPAYRRQQPAASLYSQSVLQRWYTVVSRYPFRIFTGFVVFAVSMSFLYHGADWALSRSLGNPYDWSWSDFLQAFSFEQSLSWLLALVMYNGSRRILRPLLSWLSQDGAAAASRRVSVKHRIVIFAVAMAVIISSEYINMSIHLPGGNHYAGSLLGIAAGFILLSFWFARMAINDTVNDIDMVRDSLSSFNQLEFPQSIQRLDVESADEVGDLKRQFNALQDKTEHYYQFMSSQLELAYRVQVGLLPQSPLVADPFTIRGSSRPASQLGGDFFQHVQVDEDTIAVLIGDVSGKGLPAALVTGLVLGLFGSEVRHGGSASDMLVRMNDSICKALTPDMYVSAGLLLLQRETGHYQYASAGHLPPIHFRGGVSEEWELSSVPLGIDEVAGFPGCSGHLRADDILVLYTDGLVEARLRSGGMVGFERVRAWLEEAAGSGQADGCEFIERVLDEKCESRQDDQTLVWVYVGSRA